MWVMNMITSSQLAKAAYPQEALHKLELMGCTQTTHAHSLRALEKIYINSNTFKFIHSNMYALECADLQLSGTNHGMHVAKEEDRLRYL